MIKTISLFSGGGGLDLGFANHGYDIVFANDNDTQAIATYKRNFNHDILEKDITSIDSKSLPKADIIIGGPPCQSFSLVGKRRVDDERADLVWKYLEIVREVNPKFFVFENVVGLKSAKNINGTYVLDDLRKAFEELGYSVKAQVLNAADYGVPQRRKRMILVGNNAGIEFSFPKPTHNENEGEGLLEWVSVENSISDLGEATIDGTSEYLTKPNNGYQKLMRENHTENSVLNHYIPQMSDLDKKIISYVKPGGNYMDVPDHVPSNRIKKFKETGGRTTCYGRLLASKPAYTINTHFNRPNVGCNIHYSKDRLITVREALRIQSFPDDYEVISKTKRGYHTIVGNAVPPLLGSALASQIKQYF